jgi:ribosomal protein L11 methyltransferase
VIDPGRAFGTGAHPTTRLCVELLSTLEPATLADVGCGSGVLGIAAVKLGFFSVVCLDNDPAAIDATRRNAAANGVSLETRAFDLASEEPPAADVAVANISRELVEQLLPRLSARVAVTSGYLASDPLRLEPFVRRERRVVDGWAADLLTRAR